MEKTLSGRLCARVMAAACVAAAFCPVAGAVIRNVSNVTELNAAVSAMGPGDEIVLAPNTYNLSRVIQMNTSNVTIRGASGNRDDVLLVGGGMNTQGVNEGITVGADDVSIRDLTLKSFFYNAIHIRAESDADRTVVSNVKTWNIGERHIKGSRSNNTAMTSDDVLIENVYMLQTEPRLDTNPSGPDYIGGMDIMFTNNIIIRDCVAEGIRGANGEGNASIFLWQGHNNFLIERNIIIDTNKGIGIGLTYPPAQSISGGWHGDGGVIRNNFILRGDGQAGNNIGMELCHVKNTKVYNNTIYSPDATYFRTLSLWDSATYPNDNLEIVNNIIRGMCWDTTDYSPAVQAAIEAMGNIVDTDGTLVLPAWFADAPAGDLHLTDQATAAIDAAPVLAEVPEDIDQEARPIGALADFGADEYMPEPASVALLVLGGLVPIASGIRRRSGRST